VSKCNLSIAFDRETRTYQAGETVTGALQVQVSESVRCKELKIEFYWETHGKGNRNKTVIASSKEIDLNWSSGVEQSVPFGFKIPSGPLTYHGHLLNIDYYVAGRANIPWASDPKTLEEILVLPGIEVENGLFDDSTFQSYDMKTTARKLGDMISRKGIMGSLIALAVAILFAFYFLPVALIVFVAALFGFGKEIRRYVSEKRLGDVKVDLNKKTFAAGDKLSVNLSFSAPERIKVNAVSATLIGEEICDSGSGTNVTRHKKTLHKESIPLSPSMVNAFYGEANIPDTNACSFKSIDNEIAWNVLLKIDVPRWPDWNKSLPIEIVPKRKRRT
jgi:hypothetical protein